MLYRIGASVTDAGLADGYFVIAATPPTIAPVK